jgi:succinoglycan biosynthesis protein ExoA
MRMDPFVTVIVPVRNEERCIEATLRSLLTQRYPTDRFEVLLIDGQSEDATCEIVRRLQAEFANLHLLYNPRRLSSAARNLGVQQARGDFLLLVDGHCELRSATYLRNLVDVFERHGVESVGRPQPLEISGASPLQRTIAAARRSRLGHNPGSYIYAADGGLVPPQSVAIAYRRDVFERVGQFDESFDACEDVEFNHRLNEAGARCWFAPQLAVHYYPRASLAGLMYQMLRYGRGRARLLLKHPNTLSLGPLIPAGFLLALAGTLALGLANSLFAALFCLIALIYSLAIVSAGCGLALRRHEPELAPFFPAVFMSIHFAAGWGVLAELMRGLIKQAPRIIRIYRYRVAP